jgi:dipeptidyl aminopeptidase/acylaminoacyl peptidase
MPAFIRFVCTFGLIGAAIAAQAQQLSPFTPQDLVSLRLLSDPRTAPDGHRVAFVLRETDLEANKGRTDLWMLDLDMPTVQPRRLTQHAANDSSPRWSPDGQYLFFLSTRSGSSQVWRLALAGGEALQVTDYPLDVGSFKVSPAGDRLALSIAVVPQCIDLACSKSALDAAAKGKATGRQYDRLFVRHWDTWGNGTRSHLFVAPLAGGKAGAPIDVSRTLDADVPSKPFGGDEEFAFSPDGQRLVFSARAAGREESWSTNFDLYQVAADGSAHPENLTSANPAWDTQPVFLKNGDLAYLATSRPGFESDRFQVMLREARTGAVRPVAKDWDRSVAHLAAAADGRTLLASADDTGQAALFSLNVARGTVRPIVSQGQVTDFAAARESVVYGLASLGGPADLYVTALSRGAAPRRLTSANAEVLGKRAMSEFEQFNFKGWNGETVYGYVMKPFGYREGARYPIAFIIHGGPQVAFGNAWSFRWNPQVFAGHGYGVVFVDFHGSPGYGQAFTDSISKDWGGKPLEDLQKGLAAATQKYPWLDGERACALGASYGGYMINWIAGQWPERFRCLVNHDGIFDERMMYYSTEELWFPEWEHGAPYYADPQSYERHNPANFVSRWRTPMLVIHGEQDFRVPYSQGLATFTALQRQGIESRLLVFPDENHWVLKPANSLQWHAAVFDWLDAHLRK